MGNSALVQFLFKKKHKKKAYDETSLIMRWKVYSRTSLQ